jgi:hypothetical protein
MEELKKSWVILLNMALVLLGMWMPGVKDLLTPEFEMSLVAAVNGLIAVYARVKEMKQ